jgi:hypothetical protein
VSANADTLNKDKAKPGRDVRRMTRVAPIRLGGPSSVQYPRLEDKMDYSDAFVIVVTTPSR